MSEDCQFDVGCRTMVTKLSKTIYGNGEPQKSIIVQVSDMRRELNVIKKLSWVTAAGVLSMLGKVIATWLELKIIGQ